VSEPFASGLVTVVVASYNHARFLERRMNSLLAQTYAQLEIIVIDDRSPDNSVEILRRYESDPRVKLIVSEKNAGWVRVSNQGAQLGHGEFVLFGNCDDDCGPAMIEALVAAMRAHPSAGIAFCRSLFTDEHDNVIGSDYQTRERQFRQFCKRDALIPAPLMSRFLLDSCAIPNLSAALIRRDVFLRLGGLSTDFLVCSDWDFFFRLAAKHDVAYVARPLNNFRQHGSTIRSTTKERVINEETFGLLLRNLRAQPLTTWERARCRAHVMFLWAVHIVAPSRNGLRNIAHLWGFIWQIDPAALLFLPVALVRRSFGVIGKIFSKLLPAIRRPIQR
jgi:glycosyltransferase involved in cell wall biosynthesis